MLLKFHLLPPTFLHVASLEFIIIISIFYVFFPCLCLCLFIYNSLILFNSISNFLYVGLCRFFLQDIITWRIFLTFDCNCLH